MQAMWMWPLGSPKDSFPISSKYIYWILHMAFNFHRIKWQLGDWMRQNWWGLCSSPLKFILKDYSVAGHLLMLQANSTAALSAPCWIWEHLGIQETRCARRSHGNPGKQRTASLNLRRERFSVPSRVVRAWQLNGKVNQNKGSSTTKRASRLSCCLRGTSHWLNTTPMSRSTRRSLL